MTQIHRPARLATRAASFRYGGRHHSGIPGDIIPLYPGDFVGIRILDLARSSDDCPSAYVRRGGLWKVGPTPAAGTAFRIDYYDEFPSLADPTDSGYLTTGPTDLVIYAALSYAGDWFVDKRAPAWEARFQSIVAEVQSQADQDALINAAVAPAYHFPEF